jgi:phosphate:Na+ symporter
MSQLYQVFHGEKMEWFKLAYTLLGGLGLFFYGMTQLSESLQAIAGDVMKRAINFLTKNRFIAVFVGLVITMIIQSSSVTTVMLVGFVNAGLMNMTQACGVILGADIGTTITGWIIAIKVGKYGLLLIGIGIFPMIFSKNDFWKSFGRLCFALGLVFYGLQLMSIAFKPLRSHEGFLSILSYFSADTLPSVLGCVLVGGFVTAVIQSSSATLGIPIAMAITGVIPFQTAAALVLGENIGTTITAYLASLTGNTNAKRTAYAHIMFKVVGVCIIVLIFYPYIKFVDW